LFQEFSKGSAGSQAIVVLQLADQPVYRWFVNEWCDDSVKCWRMAKALAAYFRARHR